jgi:hypothetical protein
VESKYCNNLFIINDLVWFLKLFFAILKLHSFTFHFSLFIYYSFTNFFSLLNILSKSAHSTYKQVYQTMITFFNFILKKRKMCNGSVNFHHFYISVIVFCFSCRFLQKTDGRCVTEVWTGEGWRVDCKFHHFYILLMFFVFLADFRKKTQNLFTGKIWLNGSHFLKLL